MTSTILDRANAFLLRIEESGQDELVRLYQPILWRRGEVVLEMFADAPDDFPERIAYICMLLAVLNTPTLATREAKEICTALMNHEDVRSFFTQCKMVRARDEAELDAQVRPMLAWLDAAPEASHEERPPSKWQAFRQRRNRR